ncbi:MAG: nucleotidyltransferase domain-containing protein [Eubacteriaceae bacterium]|nr:nucleotidyltransferase domain-containing protein [Eubacteriaceae bacterium]
MYVRTEEEYLRLNPIRDVLELPIDDELDINGWDLLFFYKIKPVSLHKHGRRKLQRLS